MGAEEGRLPKPKNDLEVIGSMQYKGANRDGLTTGMMIIGLRNPVDGQEYMVNSEGLKEFIKDDENKALRAKLAADGMNDCTVVTDVSEQIKVDGTRLPDGTWLAGSGSAQAGSAQSATKRVSGPVSFA